MRKRIAMKRSHLSGVLLGLILARSLPRPHWPIVLPATRLRRRPEP
jgi:hypothetical protein